jgi:hypothetical protein
VITGAFIAESASVVDSKLNVTGGVLSRFVVDVDRIAELLLVVLTQAETDTPDHLINVEIRPPSGDEPQYLEFELPPAAAGGEIGFAYFRIEVVLPIDGRWVIVVTGGAGVVSLPLMVSGDAPH